jgi:hypothetical protein
LVSSKDEADSERRVTYDGSEGYPMVISIKSIRTAQMVRQYRRNKILARKIIRALEWIKELEQNAVHSKGEEPLDVFCL